MRRELCGAPPVDHLVGLTGELPSRISYVHSLIWAHAKTAPKCLGTTAEGYPRHPLYLPNETKLVDFAPQGQAA